MYMQISEAPVILCDIINKLLFDKPVKFEIQPSVSVSLMKSWLLTALS